MASHHTSCVETMELATTTTHKHSSAAMLAFGLLFAIALQTINRLSFVDTSYAPFVRYCLLGSVALFARTAVLVWFWRLVFPHLCKTPKMIWQVLILFIAIDIPWLVTGFNSPRKPIDMFNGRAPDAFKHWNIVYQVGILLFIYTLLPWFYSQDVRLKNRCRFLKKMFIFAALSLIAGLVGIALTLFGEREALPIIIVVIIIGWTVVLILDRHESQSHERDFSSVFMLTVVVGAN